MTPIKEHTKPIKDLMVSFKEGDGSQIHEKLMVDTFTEQMLKMWHDEASEYMQAIKIDETKQSEILSYILEQWKM